ncbi:putative bifunctional diguanylate cyclase/phosphodiesterase [Ferrimonas balearica]|uniref:putative bifunctional diguanylate cyclase/phosphodiesterase n=1 Tax=Ferrimonas balearica TaxID=44012 RepID=UPI001F26AD68|nr:bifunctional diguanylate cyclase/phosphodiesterase [Ferrimonas balearica]MBY6093978.1 EAL domain-containing protein [Ferrimonas balearica]
MLWTSWTPFRVRLLLLQLLLILAGTALSWQVYHSGKVVNSNTHILVNEHLPELLQIRNLIEEQLRSERLLYEYYADQSRDHYLTEYFEAHHRLAQVMGDLKRQLPEQDTLHHIERYQAEYHELAKQLDHALSQTPVDWDLSRMLLNQISALRGQTEPLLQQLERELNQSAQQGLAETQQSTRANTRYVVSFSVLIVLLAFIGSVVASRLLTDRSERRRLAAFAERNPDPILSVTLQGQLLSLNPAAAQLAQEQSIPPNPQLLVPDLTTQLARMQREAISDYDWEFALGRRYLTARAVMLTELKQVQVHLRDITAASRAEAELRHRASHDQLTGLPNRHQFELDAQQQIEQHPEQSLTFGLLTLNRFHQVTSQVGFQAGDAILRTCSQRLCRALNPLNLIDRPLMLYRFGGTRFAILIQGQVSTDTLAELADTIADVFHKPVYADNAPASFHLSVEQGFARYPEHAANSQELLRCADAAVREPRQDEANYVLYAPALREQEDRLITLENELHQAMKENQFLLYFQPQQRLSDGAMIGAEALLRWQHPERGVLSPNEFIHLAERTGLIVSIGEWVLTEACIQARQWQERGLDMQIPVNLSARQMQQADFVERVANILARTGAPPHMLELELTESLLMTDLDRGHDMLCQLKALGLKLAIDDFGTGYSSLAYLKRLPMDTLKIDRRFVSSLPGDKQDSAIVRAILDLAEHLDLNVVAEGVETQAQHDWLKRAGCDVLQGYWYSRPLACSDWIRMVESMPAKALA